MAKILGILEWRIGWRRKAFLFIVAGVSLATTFVAWRATERGIAGEMEREFDFAVRETTGTIEDRMNALLDSLYGARGVFEQGVPVRGADWRDHVRNGKLLERFPGVSSYTFLERVPAERLGSFVEGVRADRTVRPEGFPKFTVFPAGNRSEYVVIKYVEPLERGELAFGFDAASEETRLKTMEQALAGDAPALTPELQLVVGVPGFLAFLPAYGGSGPGREHAGFVMIALRTRELFQKVIMEGPLPESVKSGDIDLEIFEGRTSSATTLLYDSKPDEVRALETAAAGLTATREIVIGDRTWTLSFADSPELAATLLGRAMSVIVLFGGILFSILVFGVLYANFTSRARALALAERMTGELRRSEEQYRSLVERVPNVIWTIDENTRVRFITPNVERLIGMGPDAVYADPQFWRNLVHPDAAEALSRAFRELFENNIPLDLEHRAKRKSGDWAWVHMRSGLPYKAGGVRYADGISEDVSGRKRTEEELMRRTKDLEEMNKVLVGRELKMVELKEENKELKKQRGG
ncbi:MAG: hypothetical protein A3E09_02080 [Candidatus Liptonbacteria bacterium RIFCSPHIGHO2_12_FULL_60_13]|uniref:histidine kinase n=1 Tax=Candidatus Liptonbacteria bacterium RIFCSPHIGHO2_12_FULL_60_13 TaxID=1798648 RepID=A0A1G2CA52_9BACT|nr:MAG: hypothetical protein A3E09_02080 [Candidatus Liptonbacteria bacterium RIFCSPHIGHO2_12_FULL_60_13]